MFLYSFFSALLPRCTVPPTFLPKIFKKTRRNAGLFLVLCPRLSHRKYAKKQNGMLALFNWEITSDLFFGTVSSVFSPNMFKKQDGMLAFFVVLCLRLSWPKLQKNKTKCSPFSPQEIVVDFCVLLYCVIDFLAKHVYRTRRNARRFY